MQGTCCEILLKMCDCYLLQAICTTPATCCQETRGVQAEILGYALRCEVGDVLLVCCCHFLEHVTTR